jgi:hypothetical protein
LPVIFTLDVVDSPSKSIGQVLIFINVQPVTVNLCIDLRTTIPPDLVLPKIQPVNVVSYT